MIMMVSMLQYNVVKSSQNGDAFMPDWASISIKEASEKTGYNEQYLRRLVRQGKIEATRIGQVYLIRASSLERYLREMRETEDGRAGPRSKA